MSTLNLNGSFNSQLIRSLLEPSRKPENAQIQPLCAKNVESLCKYYSEKKRIQLRAIDYTGDKLMFPPRFVELKSIVNTSTILDGKPQGYILTNGLNHAIPVMFSKEGDKLFLMIFDSTSGARMKGYHAIANLFPECQVLLNHGTRQEDGTSCMSDAICVLKKALKLNELGTFLYNHRLGEDAHSISPTNGCSLETRTAPKRFSPTPLQNDNFNLFFLPPILLKTAQRERFINRSKEYYLNIKSEICKTPINPNQDRKNYLLKKQAKWKAFGHMSS